MNMQQLMDAIVRAENRMRVELQRRFPEGTRVNFFIAEGQTNTSVGTVIGHVGGRFGYLRVRLDSKKSQVRDVAYSQLS